MSRYRRGPRAATKRPRAKGRTRKSAGEWPARKTPPNREQHDVKKTIPVKKFAARENPVETSKTRSSSASVSTEFASFDREFAR